MTFDYNKLKTEASGYQKTIAEINERVEGLEKIKIEMTEREGELNMEIEDLKATLQEKIVYIEKLEARISELEDQLQSAQNNTAVQDQMNAALQKFAYKLAKSKEST